MMAAMDIPLKIERDGVTYYRLFGPEGGYTKEGAQELVDDLKALSGHKDTIVEEVDGGYQIFGDPRTIFELVKLEEDS